MVSGLFSYTLTTQYTSQMAIHKGIERGSTPPASTISNFEKPCATGVTGLSIKYGRSKHSSLCIFKYPDISTFTVASEWQLLLVGGKKGGNNI